MAFRNPVTHLPAGNITFNGSVLKTASSGNRVVIQETSRSGQSVGEVDFYTEVGTDAPGTVSAYGPADGTFRGLLLVPPQPSGGPTQPHLLLTYEPDTGTQSRAELSADWLYLGALVHIEPTGLIHAARFETDSTIEALSIKSTSSTGAHAATIYAAGTTGTGVALNLINDRPADSTMYVTGSQTGRGAIKVAHLNPGPAVNSDSAAAAISIDLQDGGMGGTAAQGIFITGTSATGGTTGNTITVRNNPSTGNDDLTVRGNGRVGIGLPFGANPGARLQIAQQDNTTLGILMVANSASANNLAEFRNSSNVAQTRILPSGALATRNAMLGVAGAESYGGGDGVVGIRNATTVPSSTPTNGGVLYVQGGALKWIGSAGTVTTLAPA